MIFASSEIIEAAVHVTFYLNSSITEVYCWQLLCLDMFLISRIVLTFVTLHLTGRCCPCAPPVPRPPRQTNHNKLKHSTFYTSFIELVEFIVLKCKGFISLDLIE